MWVVEMTFDDGELTKHFFSKQEPAFKLFDKCVELGIRVKHPYYV